MTVQLLKTEMVPLTRQVAEHHRDLPQIPGDRPLKSSHVKHLHNCHESGLFYSPTWSVVLYQGQHLRIDGKHSSNMLCSLNGHFPSNLHVTIRHFLAETEEDLAILFAQFDNQVSTRTRAERARVHLKLHQELSAIAPTSVTKATSGIAYALSDDGTQKFSREDQEQLIHSQKEFILWANQFVGTRRMSRPGAVAAMFMTWMRDNGAANEFWMLVRDQSHEDPKNASRKLGKFLELSIYDPLDQATKRKWTTRAFYVKSIHAWNAWRGNCGTDLKYHETAPWPKVN
jgi:hypothetical protein